MPRFGVRRLGAFIAVELDNANAVQRGVHAGLDRREGHGVLLFWFDTFQLAPPRILPCTDAEMVLVSN